jgi:hypothetical protein
MKKNRDKDTYVHIYIYIIICIPLLTGLFSYRLVEEAAIIKPIMKKKRDKESNTEGQKLLSYLLRAEITVPICIYVYIKMYGCVCIYVYIYIYIYICILHE